MAEKAKSQPPPPELSPWGENLAELLRAMCPCVAVDALEEKRVLGDVQEALASIAVNVTDGARELYVWSACAFKHIPLYEREQEPIKPTEPKCTLDKALDWFAGIKRTVTLDDGQTQDIPYASVLVLLDAGPFLEQPYAQRKLKETIFQINGWRKHVILVGKDAPLPAHLRYLIKYLPYELPSVPQIETFLSKSLKRRAGAKLSVDASQLSPFSRACAGITLHESQDLASLALAKYRAFDHRAVTMALHEKARIVKASNLLECRTPEGGMERIGGLQHLKAFVNEVGAIFANPDAAKAYGVKIPSGLLCLGASGTGKSLTSECIAAAWQLPLLHFDIGRVFGSYIGDSERNMREVIQIAAACAPCVLRIDEIEKGLGGDSMDGNTSNRVLASILTWLEEKPDNIFVVATANDVRALARRPELIQRFAQSFFVDLPNEAARVDILAIHMRAAGHEISAEALAQVAQSTHGYSGRELRNVVYGALSEAFSRKLPHPGVQELLKAAKRITPTYTSMRESMQELRSWCLDGRAIPAGDVLENITTKTKSEQTGLALSVE